MGKGRASTRQETQAAEEGCEKMKGSLCCPSGGALRVNILGLQDTYRGNPCIRMYVRVHTHILYSTIQVRVQYMYVQVQSAYSRV